jgi:hypothetical protein
VCLSSAIAVVAVLFVVVSVVVRSCEALVGGALEDCDIVPIPAPSASAVTDLVQLATGADPGSPPGCVQAFNWNKSIFQAIRTCASLIRAHTLSFSARKCVDVCQCVSVRVCVGAQAASMSGMRVRARYPAHARTHPRG